ncbi:MAG: hypothetical protein HY294_11730 [Candidatus Rokubacteria bacterium]|nr:hypothetical protein [Candidatus Rokubacteria bacterium]MBI3826659.1 hypothetical protein [Candidatus Rokubacteria bacterium]
MRRRRFLGAGLALAGGWGLTARRHALAAAVEIAVPADLPAERFDFETKGIDGWTTVDGRWAVEEMAGAPSGRRVLAIRGLRA